MSYLLIPMNIKTNDRRKLIRSQPAARHSGSPTTGSQENNNAGEPQRRSHITACCRRVLRGVSFGQRSTIHAPSNQLVNPSAVLPRVAMPQSASGDDQRSCAANSNMASELPGSRVAERKPLMAKPHNPQSLLINKFVRE